MIPPHLRAGTGPADSTTERLMRVEAIRQKAVQHNKGITTLWAIRNATKRLCQEWGVADMASLFDDGRTTLVLGIEPSRVRVRLRTDQAYIAFWNEVKEVAEQHGYETDFGHAGVTITRIPA